MCKVGTLLKSFVQLQRHPGAFCCKKCYVQHYFTNVCMWWFHLNCNIFRNLILTLHLLDKTLVNYWEKQLWATILHIREVYAVVQTVLLKWRSGADLTGHDWCHVVNHPTDNVLLVIQSQFLYVLQVCHMPLATGIPNIVTTPCAPYALSAWLPFAPCTIGYPIMWGVEMLWVSGAVRINL